MRTYQCPRCAGLTEAITLYDHLEECDAFRCVICRRVYFTSTVRRRTYGGHTDGTRSSRA